MAQAVREGRAPARVLDHAPRRAVDLRERHAGAHDLLGRFVGAQHRVVDGALVCRGLSGEEGARHVRAVPVALAAHVKEDHVAGRERGVVGLVVRVRRMVPEAHDGGEGVVLRAEAAVLAEQGVGDLALGDARADLVHEPGHGLVVCGRRRAHELALARVLDGAGVVNRVRGEHEGAGRARLHERHEPPGGEVLVHAEGARVVGVLADQGDGVVGVGEAHHARPAPGGVGEELVCKEHGLALGAHEQREEALVGLGVVAAQPPDRKRVDHERLRKAPVGQVGPHPRKTRLVHPAPLVRSCGQCSRRGWCEGKGPSRHPVVNIPGGMVLS